MLRDYIPPAVVLFLPALIVDAPTNAAPFCSGGKFGRPMVLLTTIAAERRLLSFCHSVAAYRLVPSSSFTMTD